MNLSKQKLSVLLTIAGIAVLALIFGIVMTMRTPPLTPQANNQTNVSPAKKEVNALTVYHWWTVPAEAAAINKVIEVFSKQNPDVALVAAAVAGGGGDKMRVTIESLAKAGESPDTYQIHPGYEVKAFYDKNLLLNVDDIWQSEKLETVVPPVIQDMSKLDGKYYVVPINVHRSNVVWYKTSVMKKYGIDPATLTTWDAFFKAADKLRAQGVKDPIALGEAWTVAHVFETMAASEGIEFYQDWINGKVTDPKDPRLTHLLTTLKKYITYANKDYSTTGWDKAIKKIINGESGFNIMGDWTNGEFKLAGMKYGEDYGTFPVPGTQNMYGLVVDAFQRSNGAAHPTNSAKWLKFIASKEGQDAFNPLKGSISVRTDADTSKYDAYQNAAIGDFKSAKYMFPTTGIGLPSVMKTKLDEVLVEFAESGDIEKTATDITAAVSKARAEYTKAWTLK